MLVLNTYHTERQGEKSLSQFLSLVTIFVITMRNAFELSTNMPNIS